MSDQTPPGWGQPPQGTPPGQPPSGFPPGQSPSGGPPPGFGAQPPPPQGAPPGYGGQPGYGAQPPQGQPGYGQPYGGPPPTYQPGQTPGTPPRGSGGSRGILVAIAAVVVLAVGGAIAALVIGGGDDPESEEVTTSTSELNQAVEDLSSEVEDAFSDLATPPPSTPETPGEEASVFSLAVGDCFNSGNNSDEIQSVGVVPCDVPHDSEVFHLADHPDDGTGFPGLEALNQFADEQCQGQAFTDYVGVVWAESRYFTSQLTPTEASWEQGDREIVCLLYDPTTQLEMSVRGTAQ